MNLGNESEQQQVRPKPALPKLYVKPEVQLLKAARKSLSQIKQTKLDGLGFSNQRR